MSGSPQHSDAAAPVPEVSVIVPVYRDNEGLARCLQALARQEMSPERFEVIVVNNDPAHPVQAAEGEGLNLRVVEEEKPGSYAARNAGIRASSAPILAFTDADCVPDSTWLQAGAERLRSGEADLVAGEVAFFFEDPPPNASEYLDAATKLNQRVYAEAGFGATANLFVRREVIDEVGPFDAGLKSGGDYEFGRRATGSGYRIAWSPEARVRHPARRTFRALLRKSVRVAKGQKELARRGLLEHGRIGLRTLLPLLRVPPADTEYRLSAGGYLKAWLLMNLRRYVNLWVRLTS